MKMFRRKIEKQENENKAGIKRILFVVDDKKIGGVSSLLSDVLLNIKLKENIQIDLLVLNDDGTGLGNLKSNIKVIYGTKEFDYINYSFKELIKKNSYLKALKKTHLSILMKTCFVYSYIKRKRLRLGIEQKYDLEIAFKAGFCTVFTAYGNSIKKINWIHEDYKNNDSTRKYRRLFNDCLKLFDLNVIVSEGASKSFKKIYPNITKIKVIENYVNIDKIIEKANTYSPEAEKIIIDKNKISIISIGRLCHEKGYDRLIEAMQILKKEGYLKKQIQLDIIGIGDSSYGKKIIKKLNRAQVEEIKIYKSEGKCNYYPKLKEYDACLMTSRTESFGIVMVESMILKTPVITTDLAAAADIVGKNNKYGMIVENSVKGICDVLKTIISDENKNMLKKYRDNLLEYSYLDKNTEILNKIENTIKETMEV